MSSPNHLHYTTSRISTQSHGHNYHAHVCNLYHEPIQPKDNTWAEVGLGLFLLSALVYVCVAASKLKPETSYPGSWWPGGPGRPPIYITRGPK
jgi:hypothetical protein